MELAHKEDWPQARERYEAWWQGEIVDRAVIQVIAPRKPVKPGEGLSYFEEAGQLSQRELFEWFTDPEQVIPRLERRIEATYWGGEAFPLAFPVSVRLVAILAAYLGCPYWVFPGGNTGWADPVIEDWAEQPELAFDPDNQWWRLSKGLLEAAARRAEGRYYVGVPDLNGPGEIVARLRGTEELAMDLIDRPHAAKAAVRKVNRSWLRYWEACHGIIHQCIGGYVHWMGIWSESPSTDLQCDFSIMISPEMFEEFFLSAIEQQTEWVGRTIYHLDGPGAVRHLDALLALPQLNGIQWIPGAGAPPVSEWIPLMRRIQAAGKLLVLYCENWEVEKLLAELRPEGVLLSTLCGSMEEAEALLKNVERWTARRH
jgi:hypothetical protein